jgi:putative Holliday junction resolvase
MIVARFVICLCSEVHVNCLCLDVGTKTIGVARGSRESGLASPLMTLSRQSVKKDAHRLNAICLEQRVQLVVVGLPLMLDGTEGRAVRLARQIGEALRGYGNDVCYQDERFSTVEAERRLIQTGKSSKKRKKEIDQAAAAVILEQWFIDNPMN